MKRRERNKMEIEVRVKGHHPIFTLREGDDNICPDPANPDGDLRFALLPQGGYHVVRFVKEEKHKENVRRMSRQFGIYWDEEKSWDRILNHWHNMVREGGFHTKSGFIPLSSNSLKTKSIEEIPDGWYYVKVWDEYLAFPGPPPFPHRVIDEKPL
jgi:hypothetical protein